MNVISLQIFRCSSSGTLETVWPEMFYSVLETVLMILLNWLLETTGVTYMTAAEGPNQKPVFPCCSNTAQMWQPAEQDMRLQYLSFLVVPTTYVGELRKQLTSCGLFTYDFILLNMHHTSYLQKSNTNMQIIY